MDLPASKRELNRQRWFEQVRNWQHSGLTATTFCQQQQLGLASFQRWRGMVPRETPTASMSAFLPVQIAESGPSALTLRFEDDLRLEIPVGFDAETLQKVIQTLQRR